MPAPSPPDVTRQFLKDMEQMNYDAAMRWVADQCEYVNPPPLPVVHGPAGVRSLRDKGRQPKPSRGSSGPRPGSDAD